MVKGFEHITKIIFLFFRFIYTYKKILIERMRSAMESRSISTTMFMLLLVVIVVQARNLPSTTPPSAPSNIPFDHLTLPIKIGWDLTPNYTLSPPNTIDEPSSPEAPPPSDTVGGVVNKITLCPAWCDFDCHRVSGAYYHPSRGIGGGHGRGHEGHEGKYRGGRSRLRPSYTVCYTQCVQQSCNMVGGIPTNLYDCILGCTEAADSITATNNFPKNQVLNYVGCYNKCLHNNSN